MNPNFPRDHGQIEAMRETVGEIHRNYFVTFRDNKSPGDAIIQGAMILGTAKTTSLQHTALQHELKKKGDKTVGRQKDELKNATTSRRNGRSIKSRMHFPKEKHTYTPACMKRMKFI
jgi:hypothetical protein